MPHPLAQPLRTVHTGPNWTDVNLRDLLADVTWREATRTLGPHHPIATLVHHIRYFVAGVAPVLEGGALDIRDAFSFDAPAIASAADWDALRDGALADAERLATLTEALPEATLAAPFVDERYGTYADNLRGITEHTYYHLGQIALLRKLLRAGEWVGL